MKTARTKKEMRTKRHTKIRAKISGTAERPRLAVFRSNCHIYAQLIDDSRGVTVAQASDAKAKKDKKNIERAREVGANIATVAKEKKIGEAVFDRAGYIFTGRVKALAESAREKGLKF